MRAFQTMLRSEIKLYLREPAATFFTLAFPLMILFVFASIFGNDPDPQLGGRGSVDVSVPGYIGQVIATITLIGLPVTLAAYREHGIFRRLRATPIRPLTIIATHVTVAIFFTAAGVSMLTIAAKVVYDLVTPEAPFCVAVSILLSVLAFAAFGFTLAGIAPSARAAQAVGSAIFFPQLFLSGAALPREIMPRGLERATEYLPLTQVVILITDLWRYGSWNWVAVAVLLAISVGGIALAAGTFRWE